MKENAIISCLIYISSVIGKVQCLRKKVKQWRHQGDYKRRAGCVPFRRVKIQIYHERFINYPDLMIKMLSGNKNIYFPDFSCTHGRTYVRTWTLRPRPEVPRVTNRACKGDAMLEQCCNHSKQCRNNVATLCCAINRRCESSRVNVTLKKASLARV